MWSRSMFGVAFTAVLLVGATQLGGAQGKVTVKGVVNDDKGTALEGVLVEVWRAGQAASDRTKPDGSYTMTMDASPRIDQIRYSRSDLDPAVINQLSGRSNQDIGKVVLYRTGSARSLTAIDEQLHAFESLLIYGWDSAFRAAALGRLRELNVGGRLAALPLPGAVPPDTADILDSLRSRKERLVQLYNQRGIPTIPAGQ